MKGWARAAYVAVLLATAPATGLAHRCVGDCDFSDTVTISEMINGVRISLGEVELETCYQFDADLDDRVSINELLVAVNNVFSFCGHGSPPTPTSTPTSSPTATRTPL